MDKSKFIYLFLLIILCCCTENEVVLVDNRHNDHLKPNEEEGVEGEYIINFNPKIINAGGYIGGQQTPFAKGNVAQIYVAINKGQFLLQPYYRALAAGTLTPIEEPIIVVTGYYDFYFTSINSPEYPPVMIYSTVNSVNNGIDYLWNSRRVHVESNNTDIPITFTHQTAQIVVNCKNYGQDKLVHWIEYAMIEVPDTTGMKWNLYDGQLAKYNSTLDKRTPSQSLLPNPAEMKCSALTATLCVLPLEYDDDLDLYLSMRMYDVNTTDDIRDFSVDLPIPDGKLLAGNSYNYTIHFESDTVYVGDVEINSWVEVDLDGNPLYPTITND